MWLDVLKYVKPTGEDNLPCIQYEILPEEDELVEERLWRLYKEGIPYCTFIGLEVNGCVVRNPLWVYFPTFGTKVHISKLVKETRLARITKSELVDIKEYLER